MWIRSLKKGEPTGWALIIADLAFVFCIVSNILSAHNRLGQLGLIAFGFSVLILIVQRRVVSLDRFFIGYGVFILWGLTGVLAGWATDKTQAFSMVKTLVIDFGFLFLVFQYLKSRGSLERPFIAYMLAALVTIALIFPLSGPSWIHYRFGQLAGVNPNELADMLLPAWCGVVYLFFDKKRKMVLVPGLIFFAAIVLTGSRQGLLGFAVFTLIYILWADRKHIVRDSLILVVLAAAAFAVLYYVPFFYKSIGSRLMNTIKGFLGLTNRVERSISQRRGYFEAALRLFLERPFTGWGYDCFRFASGAGTYAHSNYYELLADGGILALVLFYAPVVSVMVRAFRKAKTSPEARLGSILMLMLLALGIASVSYYDRVDLILIPFAAYALGFEFPKERK